MNRWSKKQPAKILIVDDHPIVCEGYKHLIEPHADLSVCGCAATTREALDTLRSTSPDVVIIDITLQEGHGIDLVEQIKSRAPQTRLLVVSAHSASLYAERALHAGALGYINKQEAVDRLIEGIRSVLADRVFLSEDVKASLLRDSVGGHSRGGPSPTERLTNRELEVLGHIGCGQTSQQIAEKMHLSRKTIDRYRENIKAKLELANSTELVRLATQWVMENS